MKITAKWRSTNKSRKPKPHIRTPKIQWQQLGLTDPAKETTSIDEIRRQVLLASSRGIGQAARAQSDEHRSTADDGTEGFESKRPRRRGATE
jgi:hypothetical protein